MIEDASRFPVISPAAGPGTADSLGSATVPTPAGAMNPTPGKPDGVVQPAVPVPPVTHIDGNAKG